MRALLDFNDFDPVEETLAMLKPMYWLTDAPRACRKKLHQSLIRWKGCRQLYAEPEFCCVHGGDVRCRENTIQRAVDHNEVQRERGDYRKAELQAYVKANLLCLLSVHVGDIKGAATKETAESSLKTFQP